jgi:hypothetical protein
VIAVTLVQSREGRTRSSLPSVRSILHQVRSQQVLVGPNLVLGRSRLALLEARNQEHERGLDDGPGGIEQEPET